MNLLTLANIAAISDTIWKEDMDSSSVRLNNSLNLVGIGEANPKGKMVVRGDSIHNATDTIPLFAVKDKDGNDVFVVYPQGVLVYVDTITDTSGYKDNITTRVTGFRVGKKTGAGSKGFDDEYFTISPAGNVDTLGSQARILWYPLKEAFLSGRVIVESPDSVGYNSWASGYLSKSIGDYSQALGYRPKAVGNYSTAIGNYALALGDNSFALGDSTIAGGGGGNKAASNNCYAFGKGSAGDVANDPSEKMRILSNGYVGIGSTSPNAVLHVNGPSGAVAARIQVNGQSKFTVASNGGVSIGAYQDRPPSNGLYVSGSVGIGTYSPAYQLDVNGWIRSSHVRLGGNTDGGAWSLGVSGQSMLRGVVWMPDVYSHPISGSYTYLRINSDGDLGTLSSSKRYKENITDMENIAWLYDLRPVNYNYINDSSKTKRYGLIAEEVEKVNNHFVAYFNNGAIYTVNYDDLITPMLKAIQELNQKISEQQQTIIELQHQVSESKADNELLKNMSLQMEEMNKKYDALMAKQGVSSNK